jgi:integrase
MAHIEKRGPGKYRVRYRDPNNKERSKTFTKKVDAERFKTHVMNEINRGSYIAPERGRQTFSHYAELWMKTLDPTPSTKANYESILNRHLLPSLGQTEVSRIQWSTLEHLKNSLLEKGLHPKTVRNIMNPVSGILKTAVRDGAIVSNPSRELSIPKNRNSTPVRPASPEEILDLTAEMTTSDRLLVLFAAFSGLRAGECGGLRVGDLDFANSKVHVVRSITEPHGIAQFKEPKNGKNRSVPLPPFLMKQLTDHLKHRGVTSDPTAQVFTSPDGGLYRHSNFYSRIFKPAVKAHGLGTFTFHHLRHTYASMLIKEGTHPRVIMDRMGHSNIQITMNIYGHLFPDEDGATIDGLERAFNEANERTSRPVRGLTLISKTA